MGKATIYGIISSAALFSFPAWARADLGGWQGRPCYGPMMGYGWHWGGFMMVFWILIIILIAYLIYGLVKGKGPGQVSETPLDILKKRYARGELTKEEFEQMKKDLL
ncbi:MAG: SHOCT domain-containing protein [Smithellaceae bacterium]|nr:SHOCT domain-containing protein [Smithellaceae bacterium]